MSKDGLLCQELASSPCQHALLHRRDKHQGQGLAHPCTPRWPLHEGLGRSARARAGGEWIHPHLPADASVGVREGIVRVGEWGWCVVEGGWWGGCTVVEG